MRIRCRSAAVLTAGPEKTVLRSPPGKSPFSLALLPKELQIVCLRRELYTIKLSLVFLFLWGNLVFPASGTMPVPLESRACSTLAGKAQKRLSHVPGQGLTVPPGGQLMAHPRDRQQLGARRNEWQCRLHLRDRSKRIPAAVDEQRRRLQPREMPRPQLIRTPRRVQRIRQQQQRLDLSGSVGNQHRGLPASIGMSAQEHAA